MCSTFAAVNLAFGELGEDDDEAELSFDEFVELLTRLCHIKIPLAKRSGQPFELTLQSWLHVVFIPTYNSLLAAKRRGVLKKTL